MIVVSDTPPINYLVLLGADGILPRLYDRVVLPGPVVSELRDAGAPGPVHAWAATLPAWVDVRSPRAIDPALVANRKLDEGEIHAISLAEELAAPLPVDEREATRVAIARGLSAMGVLGVLDKAAQQRLIDLKTTLRNLTTTTNFRYRQKLIDRLLDADARRRGIPPP